MLTKTALNKLTQAVTNKVLAEARAYNQKLIESVSEEDLYGQFCNGIEVPISKVDKGWQHLKTKYPPVFTELLSCLREDRKLDRLDYPCSYNLQEIVRPEVERLTADLNEFDSDSLLTEQVFEKIYPMLVEAKYIRFESEKNEPVFDLSLPLEETPDLDPDSEEEVMFDPPYASSGNENSIPFDAPYDEGDWE
jgi:hypothetical protein